MTLVECREHAHLDETLEKINYEILKQPIDLAILEEETGSYSKGQSRRPNNQLQEFKFRFLFAFGDAHSRLCLSLIVLAADLDIP